MPYVATTHHASWEWECVPAVEGGETRKYSLAAPPLPWLVMTAPLFLAEGLNLNPVDEDYDTAARPHNHQEKQINLLNLPHSLSFSKLNQPDPPSTMAPTAFTASLPLASKPGVEYVCTVQSKPGVEYVCTIQSKPGVEYVCAIQSKPGVEYVCAIQSKPGVEYVCSVQSHE
ncbi:hypothetical protein B0A55_07269 [Friedmanniomyces simplex]|uniref:Uncharacterized protein n=1 Tax=Friedmanniomyces simplex TaxID=329884 RepID=A0A4U0WZZ8_9PEZI|nr:hypothetical protein B0A55_07269 [Friedmanniomyces simplex]